MSTLSNLKQYGLTDAELALFSVDAMEARVARVQAVLLRALTWMLMLAMVAFALHAPEAMAQNTSTYGGIDDASSKLSGFLKGVKRILGPLSVLVVTIAFIFAGYQIAFNHKRIGDVAPVLIGAIVIGASAQLAKMFIDADEFNDK